MVSGYSPCRSLLYLWLQPDYIIDTDKMAPKATKKRPAAAALKRPAAADAEEFDEDV